MATPFQLRRDILGADPSTGDLREGELGYAYASDKLFIGGPAAGSIIEIGGGSLIALLTATPGVATADKAVILDSSAEIDAWTVAGLVEAQTFKTSLPVNAGFVKNDASGNLLFGETGEQSDLDLDNLADVTIVTPVVGEYLCFAGPEWVNAAIPFNDLSDVVLTSPASGEILSFTGANWVNSPAASLPGVPTVLDDLTDVDTTTAAPSLSDVLTFDGSLWVPLPSPSAPTSLNALTDVTLTAVALGEFLRNDGAGQFVNVLLVEADISDLQSYSLVGHTHVEADITDLQSYALAVHTHVEADITDLQSYALAVHTHVEADITDLQNYTVVGHTHVEADITDLQNYALAVHTHVEADITDLQNYSLVGHTHVEADISDLQNYALVGHTHLEADITDLQAYLLDITTENLADLADVVGVPSSGQVLQFNGSNWVPFNLSESQSITQLSDVQNAPPSDKDLMRFDFGFGEFVFGPAATFDIVTLTDLQTLTNKTLTNPTINAISSTGTLTVSGNLDIGPSTFTGGAGVLSGSFSAGSVTTTGDVSAFDFKSTNPTATSPGFVKNSGTGTLLYGQVVSLSLDDLTGVFVPTPSDGEVLTFVNANNRWESALPSGGVASLNAIPDCDVPSPSDGEVLKFNNTSGNWEAGADQSGPASLGGLTDVTLTLPSVGEFIRHNGAGQFVNVLIVEADISDLQNYSLVGHTHLEADITDLQAYLLPADSIDSLADVDTTTATPSIGEHLEWDGSNWVPGTAGGGATDLDGLSDVTITSPATDALLQYNGSQWIDQVNLILDSTAAAYLGGTAVNGSWRVIRVGNDLDFQRREGGVFRRVAQMGMNTNPGTNVNSVGLFSNHAGFAPGIRALGTNADLELRSSGTGNFILNRPGGSTPAGLLGLNASGVIVYNQSGGATQLDELSDVTITAAASGDFLRHNGSAWVDATIIDADVPNDLTLERIELPVSSILNIEDSSNRVHLRVATTTGFSPSGNIRIQTGVGPGAAPQPAILVEGTETNIGLQFETKGTGPFRFQPGGSNPAAGLLAVDSSGNLLFAQSVTDADVPNDLTLERIELPAGLLNIQNSGNVDYLVVTNHPSFSPSGNIRIETGVGPSPAPQPRILVEGTETNIGLQFETKGTGKFIFQPSGGNPSAGLLGVDSSGQLLFNQGVSAETIALDELSDVTLTAAGTGDFLRKSAGDWVNTTISDGDVPNILTLTEVLDPNTETLLTFGSFPASDGNLRIQNSLGSAPCLMGPEGTATNLSFRFVTKGTGTFQLFPNGSAGSAGILGLDGGGNILFDAFPTLTDADIPNILTLTEVLDPNTETLLTFGSFAGSDGNLRIQNSLGAAPCLMGPEGTATNLSFRFVTKGTGTFQLFPNSSAGSAGLLGLDGSGNIIFAQSGGASALNDLSDVTITSPVTNSILAWNGAGQWVDNLACRLNFLVDLNGAKLLEFVASGFSAGSVNYVQIENSQGSITTGPTIRSIGPVADAFLKFETKGSGSFVLLPGGSVPTAGLLGVDASGNVLFNQSGGGASALNDLSDVTITGAATGEFLRYDGAAWVDTTISDGDVPNILTMTQINDVDGNEQVVFVSASTVVNYMRIFTSNTGLDPALGVQGDDANIGLRLAIKGTGVFTLQSDSTATGLMKIGASDEILFGQSLTDAEVPNILTLTQIDELATINDSSGNEMLLFVEAASAVNYMRIFNSATGLNPALAVQGSDTDISLRLAAKGTGAVEIEADLQITSATDAFYLGDRNVDGTWRFVRSGDDLLVQQREAGTYNTKTTHSGA